VEVVVIYHFTSCLLLSLILPSWLLKAFGFWLFFALSSMLDDSLFQWSFLKMSHAFISEDKETTKLHILLPVHKMNHWYPESNHWQSLGKT
jgi:hypothetical protein